MSKKYLMWIVVAAIAAGGFFGYQYWRDMQTALPKGIAWGNGRMEAKLVDIAAKEALRVKEILVDEGALVKPGDVLVRMDTATLQSQLAEARLNVAATRQKAAIAKAAITRSKAQIELAKVEVKRSTALVAERASSSGSWIYVERCCKQPRPALRRRKPSSARTSKRSKSPRRTWRRSKPASTTRRSHPRSREECCIDWPKSARSWPRGARR